MLGAGAAGLGPTRMLGPSGAPMSTIDEAAFWPQAIHAFIPAFCCSGVAVFIWSKPVVDAR